MSEQGIPREMPLRAWPSLCLAFCPGTLISHCPVHSLNGGNPEASLAAARVTLIVYICTCYRPASDSFPSPEQGLQVPKPPS